MRRRGEGAGQLRCPAPSWRSKSLRNCGSMHYGQRETVSPLSRLTP